jgi:uncharacterized damage-inducible protein DinB
MRTIERLVRHAAWANRTWIDFIDALPGRGECCLTLPSHILHGERAWFQRIAGEAPGRNLWTPMSIEELRHTTAAHESHYGVLLAGDLERMVRYTRFTGEQYASSVGDILTHLVTHGAHHRGQLAAHVRAAHGVAPVNADYIQFCMAGALRARRGA